MMKESKRNSLVAVIITQLLLLQLQLKTTESTSALPGCQESCGGIAIPYPFGIGSNCSKEGFEVSCNTTNYGTSTPYLLGRYLQDMSGIQSYSAILNIDVTLGQARISSPISSQCFINTPNGVAVEESFYDRWRMDFGHTPFWINTEKNKFIVTGCNALAILLVDMSTNFSVGCLSSCDSQNTVNNYGSCSGIGCCQTALSKRTTLLYVNFTDYLNKSDVYEFSPCTNAMVTEYATFNFKASYVTTYQLYGETVPMVVNWAVGNTICEMAQYNKSSYACRSDYSVCLNIPDSEGNIQGYLCNCSLGYEGNPYLEHEGGCQDINECATQNPCRKPAKCHNLQGGYRCSCPFGWYSKHNNPGPGECDLNVALVIGTAVGFVALSFFGVGTYLVLERRSLSKVKAKYFQQHGGWILLEKIKANQGFGFTIFTKQQVEHATNNFDNANILGHGGHGTVYKGSLRDQTVAIKKCKIIDESKKKEFGKEMLILSQINHKNIVKILGCCLEVEVPILVYEFISNGTLYHYIHHKKPGSHISLATRLRIAHESAEALAYLHTSASPPIFHGDVKSANILLDENYMAKVSDFGASILAPTDEVQFVTIVQGTCGYLDPEYMQSCQLTDKSDVYSFGVVLLELLTSKPAIDFDAREEARSLSSLFLSVMEENKMLELLDDEIKHEDDMELISAVAELAKECLRMKGEERPTMKDVAEELHRISKLKQHPWGQEWNTEETETLLSKQSRQDKEIEHTRNYFNIDKEAEESISIGR